jgi:hypothetical protein
MSAYVVHPDTINLIASAASRYRVTVHRLAGAVRTDVDDHHCGASELHAVTEPARLAQLLWDENCYSVEHRYQLPAGTAATEGPREATGTTGEFRFRPVDLDSLTMDPRIVVLASIRCLEYQSCESDDYRQSAGYLCLDAVRHEIIRKLTNDAPWGWTRAWSDQRRAEIKARVARDMAS